MVIRSVGRSGAIRRNVTAGLLRAPDESVLLEDFVIARDFADSDYQPHVFNGNYVGRDTQGAGWHDMGDRPVF